VTSKSEPAAPNMQATSDVLLFRVGGEEFGFPLEYLCEVVEMVEIKRVDDEAAGATVGIIDYRGAVIPVVDTRKVLRLAPADYAIGARIIITDAGGETTGLLVDEVHDVCAVADDAIEPPGPKVPLKRYVSGIARLADRLLLVLDIEKMVSSQRGIIRRKGGDPRPADSGRGKRPSDLAVLRRRAIELSKPVAQESGAASEMVSVVRFVLGHGDYGLTVCHIIEIVASPRISPIPCTPAHILGAVNIRGQITPVVSLTKLLDLSEGQAVAKDEVRLIVVELSGVMVAFYVDAVLGIGDIDAADIMAATGIVDGEGASFIEGEIAQGERRLCLLDAPALVTASAQLPMSDSAAVG
jgi:purine-binding chemotaxis protein CheW